MARQMPEINGYELIECLGRGSLGEIYKARQISLKRVVALKILAEGDIFEIGGAEIRYSHQP